LHVPPAPERADGLDAYATQRARFTGSICAESEDRKSDQTSGWPKFDFVGLKKSLRPTKTTMTVEIAYRNSTLLENTHNLDVKSASWDQMYNWLRENERTENVISQHQSSEKKRYIPSKDGVRLVNALIGHYAEFSGLSSAMTRAGKDEAKNIIRLAIYN